jgi:YD repeat-containing protein
MGPHHNRRPRRQRNCTVGIQQLAHFQRFGAAGGVPTLAVQDERGYVTTHGLRAYGDPDKTLLMNIAAPIASASVAIQRDSRGLVTSATQAGITRTFGYDHRHYLTSATHPEVGTVT